LAEHSPHDAPGSRPAPLLEVQHLTVDFATDSGSLRAAEDVSFALYPGQVLGLVGESGCGKSVSAMSIPRLLPCPPASYSPNSRILWRGQNLLRLPPSALHKIRGQDIGVIFQEPMTALSPLHRIGAQLAEVYQLHTDLSSAEIRDRSLSWLRRVGIPDPQRCLEAYPHELSGGMRQRVMIAMAMLLQPSVIIADEPTTALDVTIQAQILALLKELLDKNSTLLLITHDMGVIWQMCDSVAVMYAAHLVECASREELFAHPKHPYTQGLLASIPSLHSQGGHLPHIPGQVPNLLHPRPGCPFADRCPQVQTACRQAPSPQLRAISPGHLVSCHLA